MASDGRDGVFIPRGLEDQKHLGVFHCLIGRQEGYERVEFFGGFEGNHQGYGRR